MSKPRDFDREAIEIRENGCDCTDRELCGAHAILYMQKLTASHDLSYLNATGQPGTVGHDEAIEREKGDE